MGQKAALINEKYSSRQACESVNNAWFYRISTTVVAVCLTSRLMSTSKSLRIINGRHESIHCLASVGYVLRTVLYVRRLIELSAKNVDQEQSSTL